MYNDFNDYELLYMIRQKDEVALEILLKKYHNTIMGIVYGMFRYARILRISKDELYSAGMTGFAQAVECYREDMKVTFVSFLKLCVERECRSLIRKHRGLSYSLISGSLSLDMTISEDENLYLIDTIACTNPDFDPQWQFRFNEAKRELVEKLKKMTIFEVKVVKYRMEGYSYAEIAEICNVSSKAVDNALQRIKKKLGSV